ncbi:MAG: hypothetical protein M3140_01755, partial [Actinomycetota bacterium]|nr:hypothetical protein [Actinomycetota bacterium]
MDVRTRRPPTTLVGGLIGLLATALGLGAGEVTAALTRPEAAPIVVVANRFILGTPEWLKQFAIGQFGTSDKDALRVGIYLVIAVFAAITGVRALARRRDGLLAIGGFTAVGVLCALTTSAHRPSDVIPTLVAGGVAAAALNRLAVAAAATAAPLRSPAAG